MNEYVTKDGDRVTARGLTLTVELSEKTKEDIIHRARAEVLPEVEALRSENAKLRELARRAHGCKTDDGCCDDCWGDYGECPIESEIRELGIEASDD